jgi:hypothetical protein
MDEISRLNASELALNILYLGNARIVREGSTKSPQLGARRDLVMFTLPNLDPFFCAATGSALN